MEKNYGLKMNMLALGGAFVANIQGKTAKKRCVCIPIEDAHLYEGEKGVYLSMNMWVSKNSQYGDSHYLTQNLPKEVRDAMSDEEKKSLPILGNVKVMELPPKQVQEAVEIPASSNDDLDDLPF